MDEIAKLTDVAAVKALSSIVIAWSNHRGLEALALALQTRHQASTAFDESPDWAKGVPSASPESGAFARKMLGYLASGSDDEVSAWTRSAVKVQLEPRGQAVDPISLSIVGVIIIGGILAARVKKVPGAEFYEGIPKALADVMKAGASMALPS